MILVSHHTERRSLQQRHDMILCKGNHHTFYQKSSCIVRLRVVVAVTTTTFSLLLLLLLIQQPQQRCMIQAYSMINPNLHTRNHHHHHHSGRIGPCHRRPILPQLASTTTEEDRSVPSSLSSYNFQPGQPTELPDSLSDAAIRAAEASKYYYDLMTSDGTVTGISVRGRIDFDTTLGDETFTLLKQSTPFVQQYVTALTYALIPPALQQRQSEMMAVVQAKNELQQLRQPQQQSTSQQQQQPSQQTEQREDELMDLIANNGRNMTNTILTTTSCTTTPVIRIYFPDEGSAALARRDWTMNVVPCLDYVEFRSCNGIQPTTTTSRPVAAQIFVCPRASDSDAVERLLAAAEERATDPSSLSSSLLSIFFNPSLVDMGVTGFGYAGRRLRERLLDTLVGLYYLRTLPNGALTRQYPSSYTIWQEDAQANGGYVCIANCGNRLPSNPEVIDIFDNHANGNSDSKNGGGFLDQFGDFVNGMMRL